MGERPFGMNSLQCGTCGNSIAADAPSGLCPTCLLRTAIEHGSSQALAPLLPKLRYFGDYELLEEIARGGMGVVYRARQVSLDRTVALKMMRPGLLSTEPEIRRFLSEARTAASLRHPHIVAIHEAGEFDGLHYFSMDFVEGPNLAAIVRDGPLAPAEAARYLQILAETVQFAHTKGILHRDLKPSNVLVDSAGRPSITDFGLARRIESNEGNEGNETLTGSGAVIGTPAYMAPEQASGEGGQITAASDVYSLGAILYELLTGQPPFRAASQLEIVRMVLETEPQPPRLLNPVVDAQIEAICLRCLAKDPARRFRSAGELANDLKRYLAGEPVHSRARRNAWPVVAAGLLLVVIVVAWLMVPGKAPKKTRSAHPRRNRSSRKTAGRRHCDTNAKTGSDPEAGGGSRGGTGGDSETRSAARRNSRFRVARQRLRLQPDIFVPLSCRRVRRRFRRLSTVRGGFRRCHATLQHPGRAFDRPRATSVQSLRRHRIARGGSTRDTQPD